MARKILCTAAIGAAVYGRLLRPRLWRWGATDEEADGPFPGAGLVPGGTRAATMAVTIEAPPERVWPWLVQMGGDRGGWYSWDRLDNGGRPSAVTWPMQARMLVVLKRTIEQAVQRPQAQVL